MEQKQLKGNDHKLYQENCYSIFLIFVILVFMINLSFFDDGSSWVWDVYLSIGILLLENVFTKKKKKNNGGQLFPASKMTKRGKADILWQWCPDNLYQIERHVQQIM